MDINRRLKHTRLWFWLLLASSVLLLAFLFFYYPNYYKVALAGQQTEAEITRTTSRIPGKDAVEVSIAVAQNMYPATFKDNKPGAVILVPVDDWRSAVLAAEIIHFPVNAPILYTERESIPEDTLKEIKRLDPEGNFQDGNTKVILIGNIGDGVKSQLKKEKFKFRDLTAENTYELASLLDDYKSMIHANHDDEVIIVPSEDPAYAILATSWVAHAGHSIFFVNRDSVSDETRNTLAKRPQDAFIYVLGSEEVIPKEIAEELSGYGHVQRIPGKDAWEMAVGFGSYIDFGRNFGWWIRRTPRTFGWGVGEAGHNFTFINPKYPLQAVPAAVLSHMGKHGPFLLVKEDEVPDPVIRYLQKVQPNFTSSKEQLFNHGWIIGDHTAISNAIQQEVDKFLQVKGP